jgi:hypothetical protein
MRNTTKFGLMVVFATLLVFSLSFAFAENAKTPATKNTTNVTKNTTNVTKNMTNVTKNMTMPENMTNVTKNTTNVTGPFEKVKGAAVRR